MTQLIVNIEDASCVAAVNCAFSAVNAALQRLIVTSSLVNRRFAIG